MKNLIINLNNIKKGDLILINANHSYQESHENILKSVNSINNEILLECHVVDSLNKAIKDIGDNWNNIVAVSGYRPKQEQIDIFNDSLKENGEKFTYQYVALPGHSEHQSGKAIDLGILKDNIDFIRPDFPYEGICETFRTNAYKYGFIERYQKDKEKITGISHEPWHFRYIGIPHAKYIFDNHLALEEYIDLLKKYTKSNKLIFEGYEIWFTKDDEEIEDEDIISGNNVDGVIVTRRIK